MGRFAGESTAANRGGDSLVSDSLLKLTDVGTVMSLEEEEEEEVVAEVKEEEEETFCPPPLQHTPPQQTADGLITGCLRRGRWDSLSPAPGIQRESH